MKCDVHFPVGEGSVLGKDKIPEKADQVLVCCLNAFGEIVIVGANKCIAKIPGMLFKETIVYIKAEIPQVFDSKDRRCACIPFAEGMNLPDAGNESCNVFYGICRVYTGIGKGFLLRKIIVKGLLDHIGIRIKDGGTVQPPFLFADVVVANLSGEFVDSCKEPAVDADEVVQREGKRFLGKDSRNGSGHLVGFLCTLLNSFPRPA